MTTELLPSPVARRPFMRHRTDIQTRFGDTDALGHVNNASFAAYAELGRLEFVHHLFDESVGTIILASLYLDFRRQVKFREPVHLETWVAKIGTSSVTLRQVIYASNERAADVRSVVVYFDYQANRARALPPEIRATLEPWVENEA
jgi:acyl-CoA thioester hydrolase